MIGFAITGVMLVIALIGMAICQRLDRIAEAIEAKERNQ